MNQGDQPAYPITSDILDLCGEKPQPFGLTKREYFAGLAMQSFISDLSEVRNGMSKKDVTTRTVELSIQFADELLKQLNS